MKRPLLLVFFSILTLSLFAQKEANWWYFGNRAGITFKSGSPVAVTDANTLSAASEGVASISNSKGGLLFYTDGNYVFNKKHQTMSNGTGLNGHNSSTQSAVVVQQPVRGNRYFIFTVDQEWGTKGFQYSIVDTAAAGGDGQVVQKNTQLLSVCAEKVNAVKHANKVDTWVVTHSDKDNKFYVYLLNVQGVGQPVVSAVGPVWANSSPADRGYSKGYLKFSPDGTKLVAAVAGQQTVATGQYSGNKGRIEIYDFDNLTGKISNPQIIDNSNIPTGVGAISGVYGVEFSPNNRFLYVSYYIPGTGSNDGNDDVWQIDMLKPTAAAKAASIYVVASGNSWGGIQLGPDGRIYIARPNATFISCIQKPNCQGAACTYVSNAVSLSGRACQFGIPTFINSFFNKAEFEWGSNAANLCENALTKFYVLDSIGVDSVRWSFDDPSTGAKNTAKGFTVYHKFSTPKSYNVFMQLYRKVISSDCYADTARKKLTIFPNPKPNLGHDTVICQGEEVIMRDTTSNSSWLWKDGSVLPFYNANIKGWHWVDVKVGGCTGRDSAYVDVIQFPKFSLGKDTLICQFDSVKFTAKGGQRYKWSMGDTIASAFAKNAGMIWARASNGDCHTYDTLYLTKRSIPTVNLGKDTLLCNGDSITLYAKSSASKFYAWSDFSKADSLKVKTTGVYWVRIADTMCISLRDTIKITFQNRVPFSLGKDTTFCKGSSFLVKANLTGAKTYLWRDNSTGSTFLAKNRGTQWVTASNGTCIYRDTINIAIDSILPFSLGKDTIVCNGSTVDKITPADAAKYPNTEFTWMGSVKNYSYPIKTTGKYYVDLRDLPKKVCKATDTILVTFKNNTPIDLGKDTFLCVGQTMDISIAKYTLKSFEWLWDNDKTSKTRKNNPTLPGGKHVVKVNDGICESRDSIYITYLPELFINELGPDMVLCDSETDTLKITAAGATKYEWKTPTGTQLATTPTYTVTTPGGTYIGIVSDGYCYKRDSVSYSFKVTPVVNLGPDKQICDGVLPTLDASLAAAEKYTWNTSSAQSSITAPNQPKAKYWVDAFNGTCKGTDSIWVYFASPPVLDFGFDDSIFCDAPFLPYDFSFYSNNTTFRWSDGTSSPTNKIKKPGVWWVVAENFCGKDSVSVKIAIDDLGCRLYFPEIFSPNGDGFNDVWKPMGQVIDWVEMVIYDRWGEIIYKGDPEKGWDGSVKDKNILVPDGVYPMTISYRQSNAGYPRLYVKNMILTVVK